MSILVTSAAGYRSIVTEQLIKDGNPFVALDNLQDERNETWIGKDGKIK